MTKKRTGSDTIDRRAVKTRIALADALIGLGPKKGVDRLQVGELAAEAKVGRSTFYAHYADRDDFIVRSFTEMFESCDAAQKTARPADTGILPSWYLFHHMYAVSAFAHEMSKSDAFVKSLPAREALFRKVAARNLQTQFPKLPKEERNALATLAAGAFSGLMREWMETGLKQRPEQVHERFDGFLRRALAWPDGR